MTAFLSPTSDTTLLLNCYRCLCCHLAITCKPLWRSTHLQHIRGQRSSTWSIVSDGEYSIGYVCCQLHNAYLRNLTGSNTVSITTRNHPFPRTPQEKVGALLFSVEPNFRT